MNLFELTSEIIRREARVPLPVAQHVTEVLVREGVLQSTDPNDLLNMAAMPLAPWLAEAARAVQDQEHWIADHGGNEAGYVARYGSGNDPDHYGDGGELIYAADTLKLRILQQYLSELMPPEPTEYRRVRDY